MLKHPVDTAPNAEKEPLLLGSRVGIIRYPLHAGLGSSPPHHNSARPPLSPISQLGKLRLTSPPRVMEPIAVAQKLPLSPPHPTPPFHHLPHSRSLPPVSVESTCVLFGSSGTRGLSSPGMRHLEGQPTPGSQGEKGAVPGSKPDEYSCPRGRPVRCSRRAPVFPEDGPICSISSDAETHIMGAFRASVRLRLLRKEREHPERTG